MGDGGADGSKVRRDGGDAASSSSGARPPRHNSSRSGSSGSQSRPPGARPSRFVRPGVLAQLLSAQKNELANAQRNMQAAQACSRTPVVRCGAKRPAERASERERERERDAADAAAKRLHVGEGAGRHPLGPPVPHCDYERKLRLQKVLYVKTLSDIFEKRKRRNGSGAGPSGAGGSGVLAGGGDIFHIMELPNDLLMRVMCHLQHEDLKPLLQTCSRLRHAALAAIIVFFNYMTPEPCARGTLDLTAMTPPRDFAASARRVARAAANPPGFAPRHGHRPRRRYAPSMSPPLLQGAAAATALATSTGELQSDELAGSSPGGRLLTFNSRPSTPMGIQTEPAAGHGGFRLMGLPSGSSGEADGGGNVSESPL